MTRALALLCLLCAAGCAASRSGGGGNPTGAPPDASRDRATGGPSIAAPADSMTLCWHAPRYGTRGCGPDTRDTLRDPVRCDVLRLKGQIPGYAPGMMDRPAGMDSVRAWSRADTVARLWAMPGQPCEVRVAGGEYVVVARNGAGVGCWSRVVR